jgi:hypothetical protein
MIARLLGQSPEQLINDDLQRLKYLLESSEFASQSLGRLERVEDFADEPEEEHKAAGKAVGGTLMGRAHSNLS